MDYICFCENLAKIIHRTTEATQYTLIGLPGCSKNLQTDSSPSIVRQYNCKTKAIFDIKPNIEGFLLKGLFELCTILFFLSERNRPKFIISYIINKSILDRFK